MTVSRQRDYIVDPLAISIWNHCAALGSEGNCLARRRLRSANAAPRLEFRGEQNLRHTDCSSTARLFREFSLAALVKRFFGLELLKGSQKANWAQRPLPARMPEYAMNDAHYLLPLAEKLEAELARVHRRDWFRQSCRRAIEQAGSQRERIQDELWRIRGSGSLNPHAGQFFARFGNGGKQKRKWQIDHHFIFCRTTNS